jgi:CDP-glucose 4,6-dehydratase
MVNKEILEFYRGKTVLITGHTGFKGSWMTYLLASQGVNVIGYSLVPSTKPSLFEELKLDQLCNSIIGDILDLKGISEVVKNSQPDFIFHLAAQPLVQYSYLNPIETFSTNIMGTLNLLEASRVLKKKCSIICITTDKVYRNNEWEFPYRETDQLGGHDPYSSSKAAAELVIESYRKSFFDNSNIFLATARAGNVIGGGDWSENRLIPDVIRSIYQNKEIILRNPNSIRPWQHVLDPIFGYLLLAKTIFEKESNSYCSSWNFGPLSHESKSVIDVCNSILDLFETSDVKITIEKSILHEANLLMLDISKAVNKLNWRPSKNTKEAIELTGNWYKDYLNGCSANELLNNDIIKFLNDK